MFNGGALVQGNVKIWTGHVWESSITFHMKDEQEDKKCYFWKSSPLLMSWSIGKHIEPLYKHNGRMGRLLDFDATSGIEACQCTNGLNTLICMLDVIHFFETLHPAILQCIGIHTEPDAVSKNFPYLSGVSSCIRWSWQSIEIMLHPPLIPSCSITCTGSICELWS